MWKESMLPSHYTKGTPTMPRRDEFTESWDKYSRLVFDKFDSFEKKIDSIGTDVKSINKSANDEISSLKVQMGVLTTKVWFISSIASGIIAALVSWLVKKI